MQPETNIVMYGDTARSADLRHVVPLFIRDPFIYIERGGEQHAFVHDYDAPVLASAAPRLQVRSLEELGLRALRAEGRAGHVALMEVAVRACRDLEVHEAVAPADFPLEVGDYLRHAGIRVQVDRALFERRRRQKAEWQIEGIRLAQRAVERAMTAVREGLRGRPGVDTDELRAAAMRAMAESAMTYDVLTIAHGPQAAMPHHRGSGIVGQGESIVVDLFPRDPRSGCWADMTRTFCVGDPPEELRQYHAACLEARHAALRLIRPGASGADVHAAAAEAFRRRGFHVGRPAPADEGRVAAFIHGLGHGVGLALHEPPALAPGGETLLPGDVVTVEPGLYRQGFGGCRIEDMILVTERGCEVLTQFDYELAV
jgi:Xaa-Pro aminopeptidase